MINLQLFAEEVLDQEDEMIDIAREANQIILGKDKEIKNLKTQLARANLLKQVPEEEVKEEPYDLNKKFTPASTDYEIALHAVKLHKYETENIDTLPRDPQTGKPKYTLGARADDVANFLNSCIEGANKDPNKFHSIYLSNLGIDSQEAQSLYNQSRQQIMKNNEIYNIK